MVVEVDDDGCPDFTMATERSSDGPITRPACRPCLAGRGPLNCARAHLDCSRVSDRTRRPRAPKKKTREKTVPFFWEGPRLRTSQRLLVLFLFFPFFLFCTFFCCCCPLRPTEWRLSVSPKGTTACRNSSREKTKNPQKRERDGDKNKRGDYETMSKEKSVGRGNWAQPNHPSSRLRFEAPFSNISNTTDLSKAAIHPKECR